MPRTFAVCRPYKTRFKKRVFAFLKELGYEQKQGGALMAGTPDQTAALWLSKQEADLLVLPFHLHRDPDGTPLDGVGVALLLPPEFDSGGAPILMPVSKYSWEASYHRRMSILREERPKLADRIVPMQEHEVGASHIAQALGARKFERKPSDSTRSRDVLRNFPKTSAMSGSFNAVRPEAGDSPPSSGEEQEEERSRPSWQLNEESERSSSSWRTTRKEPRSSASWPTARPSDKPVSSGKRPGPLGDAERSYPDERRERRKK